MDVKVQALLEECEKSGEADLDDHLIEYLDAARYARWEVSTLVTILLSLWMQQDVLGGKYQPW